MKADKDDAPEHIKNKRKSPIGAAGITAASLILSILFMAERNGWTDFAKNMISPPVHSQQTASTATPSISNVSSPKPEDLFWQAVAAEQQKPRAPSQPVIRQTSFNDSNQPKRGINTIPSQQYAQARSQPVSNRRQQTLNGGHKTTLRWEGSRQERYSWTGTYQWDNGVINYDDLCRSAHFPRKGSIEYRGCRKEAKAYLQHQCRSLSNRQYKAMYCHAESAFRH